MNVLAEPIDMGMRLVPRGVPVARMTRGQRARDRALQGWLDGLNSPNTRRAYSQGWRDWSAWCQAHSLDPLDPGPGAAGMWVADMEARNLAAKTRRQRMSIVKEALTMFAMEGLRPQTNLFYGRKLPPVAEPSSRPPLPTEHVRALLDTARTMHGGHEVAVLLCAVTGLRAAEAGQVRPSVLAMFRGTYVATIVRKGGATRLVPIAPQIIEAARRDRWPHNPRLTVTANGKRVSRLVTAAWAETRARTGITEPELLRSHALRHWHISTGLQAGVPLDKMQVSVDHKDPKTTMDYDYSIRPVEEHSSHTLARVLFGDSVRP